MIKITNILLCGACICAQSLCGNVNTEVDKRLQEIKTPEGFIIYTAQIKLESNEIAYFASEPIPKEELSGQERSAQIEEYKDRTEFLCSNNVDREGPIYLSVKDKSSLNKYLEKGFLKKYFSKAKKFQEGYRKLLEKIKNNDDDDENNNIRFSDLVDDNFVRKYLSKAENSQENFNSLVEKAKNNEEDRNSNTALEKFRRIKIKTVLVGIRGGVMGLETGAASNCFNYIFNRFNYTAKRFNYISKKPVTGFYPFPKLEDSGNDYSQIGLYIKFYGNIIMCIGSFQRKNDDAYEHRGIFRNPISVLENNYKGVALYLHAFTAAAWKKSHPEAKTMYVYPDKNVYMENLLEKEYGKSMKSTTGFSKESMEMTQEPSEGSFSLGDAGYKIPVDDLLQRFIQHFDVIKENSMEKEIEIVKKENDINTKEEEIKK